MGSPLPTSTYAISQPRTRCFFFWYGNSPEIILPSPLSCSERNSTNETDQNQIGLVDYGLGSRRLGQVDFDDQRFGTGGLHGGGHLLQIGSAPSHQN
jgi:hypothetical protein